MDKSLMETLPFIFLTRPAKTVFVNHQDPYA